MSSLLFDVPGPRARVRHRVYSVLFAFVLAATAYWIVQKLQDAGVLSSQVFNDTFQNSNIEYLLGGLVNTLRAAAVAVVVSIPVGALLAFGRLSIHRLVRWPCVAVIEFFRAVPLVLLMIILYFSFQDTLKSFGAVVVGLILYNGSVLAEVFRAGINAVPSGQSEAAFALGMRKSQVMTMILTPQAVKFMLPAIVSQCVIILKDTSLGYVVIYEEVVRRARQVALFVDDGTILVYATVAIVFIAINYSLSKLAVYLERRLARRGEKPVDRTAIEMGVGPVGA